MLRGKTAVVTGGGRGLGRATAFALAREGVSVILVSRTADELVGAVAAIVDSGGKADYVVGDVSRPETAVAATAMAIRRFGGVEILVNNAAVVQPFRRIDQVDPEEWRTSVDINLQGPYLMARACIPVMAAKGWGRIVNVTSGLGRHVLSPFGTYCVTKAGLDHLTRILALELEERGVLVNGLDPGVMDTRMQEEIREAGPDTLGGETWRRFDGFMKAGELDPPEAAARLAVFLASPACTVTGEIGTREHFRNFGF